MTSQTTWVKESAFGIWFLNTKIWLNYVLNIALDDLEALIPEKQPRYLKILDIGCGRGHALNLLDQRFAPESINAIEVDAALLQHAVKLGQRCHCQVTILHGNAENLPYPDNSFDMLFCHQSFHHIVKQEHAIEEFYRVLKPGCALLFAESCRKFTLSLVIRLLFRHPMAAQKTADEYLELITNTGFNVAPQSISKPYLWWSRQDLGILQWLGLSPAKSREETLLNLVALKPEQAGIHQRTKNSAMEKYG